MREAMLYKKAIRNTVHCFLCAHSCHIGESKRGICGVRENRGGKLYSLVYERAIACNVDPIEKKPLFHFLPASNSLSIATAGCNFRCHFCQNWSISQLSKRDRERIRGEKLSPTEILDLAKQYRCKSISYTYTEPTVFFEYAFDSAKLASEHEIENVFVTNGFMTSHALNAIHPYLDAANVDLKSFSDVTYRRYIGGRLQPVLDSILHMKKLRIWVEVTTLLIPGMNDSREELVDIARFIKGAGEDIPWHISRFHPDFRMTDSVSTGVNELRKARDVGFSEGLRYVYIGNVPGNEGEDTNCYNCGEKIIERRGFSVINVKMENGRCLACKTAIDGVW